MADKKNVTVHYRRVVTNALVPIEFKTSFDAALANQVGGLTLADNDAARKTRNSDQQLMVLLSPESDDHFCFGIVTIFKEGDVPIAEDHANGEVELKQILLEENENAIRGSSFFMIKGSHAAILNHDSTIRYLRDYLSWMLKQPIGNLAQDARVELTPIIALDGKAVNLGDVKSVKIRAETRINPIDDGAVVDREATEETSFARMIDRKVLSGENARRLLANIGINDGALRGIPDDEIEDLYFELIIKKKERNRLQPISEALISGMMNEGLERATELQTASSRRRGDAIVLSHTGEIEIEGPYYTTQSVKALLWSALSAWENQGMLID